MTVEDSSVRADLEATLSASLERQLHLVSREASKKLQFNPIQRFLSVQES